MNRRCAHPSILYTQPIIRITHFRSSALLYCATSPQSYIIITLFALILISKTLLDLHRLQLSSPLTTDHAPHKPFHCLQFPFTLVHHASNSSHFPVAPDPPPVRPRAPNDTSVISSLHPLNHADAFHPNKIFFTHRHASHLSQSFSHISSYRSRYPRPACKTTASQHTPAPSFSLTTAPEITPNMYNSYNCVSHPHYQTSRCIHEKPTLYTHRKSTAPVFLRCIPTTIQLNTSTT